MIRCNFGGPAPCIDDLCHGAGQTLCGLDMDFEREIEREIYGRNDDDDDDYESWCEARQKRAGRVLITTPQTLP